MRVGHRVDQLNVYADLIVRFLNAAFENIHHAKLICDLPQIIRCAFESFVEVRAMTFRSATFAKRVRISS